MKHDKNVEQRILNAAFKVIDRYTLSGTRMQLIADEAGIFKSNLYYYFENKTVLLVAVLSEIQKHFVESRDQLLNETPITLENLVNAIFAHKKNSILNEPAYDRVQMDFWRYAQNNETVKKAVQEQLLNWHENIKRALEKAVPDVDEKKLSDAADLVISFTSGAALQYLFLGKEIDLDEYFDHCSHVICSFISNRL